MANTWDAPLRPLLGRAVDEQDVGPWLELVELLCASEGPSAALWVLDWFALIVGMPAVKPGWGLIFPKHGARRWQGHDVVAHPAGAGRAELCRTLGW